MRYFQLINNIYKQFNSGKQYVRYFVRSNINFSNKLVYKQRKVNKQFLYCNNELAKSIHTDNINGDVEESLEELEFMENVNTEEQDSIRILFKNSSDNITIELSKCASIEEVFTVFNKHSLFYKSEHIIQTILSLRDLQKIFYDIRNIDSLYNVDTNEFLQKLYEREEFTKFLKLVEASIDKKETNYLPYILYYLNKLGLSMEDDLMQKLSLKIRENLVQDFNLEKASKFLSAIFTEKSSRPYIISADIMPKIFSQIDSCDVEDIEHLSVCLNKLHNIVTDVILRKYIDRINYLIDNKQLTHKHYKIILRVILFLNYPEWRDRCTLLTSKCILTMKDSINSLNVNELTILYEVFFKNQEPGEILNDIQRCSAKYLQQLEDGTSPQTNVRLKLFSSLIYFSSPTHRIHFRKTVEKYFKDCNTVNDLMLLRKVLSYLKISDLEVCKKYWNMSIEILKNEKDITKIIKMCENYVNFNIDVNSYRHRNFEKLMTSLLNDQLKDGYVYHFPSALCQILVYMLLYGDDEQLLQTLISKLEENYKQISYTDCFKLSQSIHECNNNENNIAISKSDVHRIGEVLNRATEHHMNLDDKDIKTSALLRSLIARNNLDSFLTETLLFKYKEIDWCSSKMIENISYSYILTSSLIPEVINKVTEYVIKNKDNIVGFNAEKVLYMCYYLGYLPINSDKFFQTVTDIIIRDQERLSGLSFIQSALSLCFFNKLPKSFVKLIFNVEFLEKLDIELANCYSKDKYPQRVRNHLMQLNRAVCIDYPECNVPWFHKKFVEEAHKKAFEVSEKEIHFNIRVKEYLLRLIEKPDCILEDIITPYGYHIHFVINLNKDDKPVKSTSSNIQTKLAILLVRQHVLTKFYTHLKGKYQLRKRHLEMLGYKVAMIHFNEWVNLLYACERLEYLSNIVWSQKMEKSIDLVKR